MSLSINLIDKNRHPRYYLKHEIQSALCYLGGKDYEKLEKMSMDFAYDTFLELKEKQLKKNEESYNKYMYALKLRTEAAIHIGIENIRKSRLLKLQKEKQAIEAEFKAGKQVYPDFRLSILVRLEE